MNNSNQEISLFQLYQYNPFFNTIILYSYYIHNITGNETPYQYDLSSILPFQFIYHLLLIMNTLSNHPYILYMNNHLFILIEIILGLNELIDKELNSRVNLPDCRKHDHYFKTMSDRTDIKHIE